MFRRHWIAGLSAVALATSAAAQQGTGEREPARQGQTQDEGLESEPLGGHQQVTGEITRVDRDQRTVTIESPAFDEEVELTVDEDATVFMDGRIAEFEQLQEGQQVRASFAERAGEQETRWIEVVPDRTPERQAPGTEGMEDTAAPGAGGEVALGQHGHDEGEYGEPDSATPGEDPHAGLNEEEAREVVGTVRSVEPELNQFVVEHAGQQWSLQVTEDTPVLIDGRQGSLAELEEGQQIRASLDAEGNEALFIEVLRDDDAGAPEELMEPGESPETDMM